MSTPITRTTFAQLFRDSQLDLAALPEATKAELRGLLGDLGPLEQIAGRGQTIDREQQITALFNLLDRLDGAADGRITTRSVAPAVGAAPTPPEEVPTTAGRVMTLLAQHLERAESLGDQAFINQFSAGRFDRDQLAALPPESREILQRLGVLAMLERKTARGPAQLSAAELRMLFSMIDSLDRDGVGSTLTRAWVKDPSLVEEEAPALDESQRRRLSEAGRAVAALEAAFVPDGPPPPPSADATLAAPGSLTAMGTVDDASFLERFRNTRIDLERLTAQDQATLEAAGIRPAALLAIAARHRDKVLRTPADFAALFAAIDAKDQNRDPHSFLAGVPVTTLDGPAMALSPMGIVVATLERYAEPQVMLTRDQLVERLQGGEIDLTRLIDRPEVERRLTELGLDLPGLRAAARSGRLVGVAGGRAFFDRLRRLDPYGSTTELSLGPPPSVAQSPSRAAEALALVEQHLVRPYDQPFRGYTDNSRALDAASFAAATGRDPEALAVTVDVRHQAQRTDTDCFVYAERMALSVASGARLGEMQDSHYMARAEDGSGYVAGHRDDFDAGRRYIDWCLQNGLPVVVGVSRKDADYNYDRITDHFVTIVGRGVDENGKLYYTFLDPATSDRERRSGRFFVDQESGMMFLDMQSGAAQGGIAAEGYQVSQVRPWVRLPSTFTQPAGSHFEEVTGRSPGRAP